MAVAQVAAPSVQRESRIVISSHQDAWDASFRLLTIDRPLTDFETLVE